MWLRIFSSGYDNKQRPYVTREQRHNIFRVRDVVECFFVRLEQQTTSNTSPESNDVIRTFRSRDV